MERFLELNRLAFSEALPRNSEGRALAIALRRIRKHYPHIEWVISFADGCQCGDGTIYRAAGFVLTGIMLNKRLLRWPMVLAAQDDASNRKEPRGAFRQDGRSWSGQGEPLDGYQMRYIYFLNPSARARLACKEIPSAEIERRGAGMYRGMVRGKQAMADPQNRHSGAAPLRDLGGSALDALAHGLGTRKYYLDTEMTCI
jgi:hypothetical protein